MRKLIIICVISFLFFNIYVPNEVKASHQYNVLDFGANGNDQQNDEKAIQECLDIAKESDTQITIYIPEGQYYINDTLTIYSNTYLKLDKNAEIIRKCQEKYLLVSETDKVTGGYGQAHDITIDGGIWDGNVVDTTIYSMLMRFVHAQNLTFKNTTVRNVCNRHMVVFSAVNNVIIENNTFEHMIEYTGKQLGQYYVKKDSQGNYDKEQSKHCMEALHIDCISYDGASGPGDLPYDGTPCKNIYVTSNTFKDVMAGVGSHFYEADSVGENIYIEDNNFENVYSSCINIINFQNMNILNNKAKAAQLIWTKHSQGVIKDNSFTCMYKDRKNDDGKILFYGIRLNTQSDVTIDNNTLDGTIHASIYLDNSKANIINNTIKNSKLYGIYFKNKSSGNINNNQIVNMVDSSIRLDRSVGSVSNNECLSGRKTNIYIYKCENSKGNILKIKDNTVKTSKVNGITLYESKYVDVLNNIVNDNGNNGISLINSNNCNVNKNNLSNNYYGIKCNKSKTIQINSNTSKFNKKHDIYIENKSTGSASNNVVTSNKIYTYQAKQFPIYQTKSYNNMQKLTYTIKNKVYNGKQIKPSKSSIVIKEGKKILKINKDYKINKITYGKNKDIGYGSVKITITGIGKYSGYFNKTIQFKVIPNKVSSLKLKGKKNKINVSWKKHSSSSGYQIEYKLKSQKKWKVKKTTKTTITLSSLKRKKTYTIRIRPYKTYGKQKIYGKYITKSFKLK